MIFPSAEKNFKKNSWNFRGFLFKIGFFVQTLITTAEVSKDLKERAEGNNIKIMDGNDLIDWIFESLPSLSPATRSKLGISDVPTLLL